jgi:SAM-dependent methyltransferase
VTGARYPAIRLGSLTTVAHPDAGSLHGFARRLAARGYEVSETPHFAVCRRPPGGPALLLHAFGESTIDEDVSPMVAEELGPLGVVASPREYGETLFAIVASTCPTSLDCPRCGRLHLDGPAIWRHYSLNTLRRLRALVAEARPATTAPPSHVEQFAAVYRRILELNAGASLLDVGSSLGFLPVLAAERAPSATVVGCDNRPEAVACASDLAAAAGGRARFVLSDVREPGFPEIGRFDTVAAVHVLEHLTGAELPAALANLLRVTTGRLVAAVPYEAEVQPLYGHEQAFTPERLRALGQWCVGTLGGGRSWVEEVSGGLLVVER